MDICKICKCDLSKTDRVSIKQGENDADLMFCFDCIGAIKEGNPISFEKKCLILIGGKYELDFSRWSPEVGFSNDWNYSNYLRDDKEPNNETLFHLDSGLEYQGGPCPLITLTCATCGGKEFNVGKGSYRTGIKCVECGWEQVVHDG